MTRRQTAVLVFLVALGSVQMFADVAGMPRLKAVAAAAQVSPAMRVFTAHQGYETHAARFSVHWTGADGSAHSRQLDPSTYAGVAGPYNRRNVYGAALAYGPILRADPRTRAMQRNVMRYAFCSPGVLRAGLGIPAEAADLWVQVSPVRADARTDLDYAWEADCDE